VTVDVGVERYLGMAQADQDTGTNHGTSPTSLAAQALQLAVENRLLSMCDLIQVAS
jgi:hypothetical protein